MIKPTPGELWDWDGEYPAKLRDRDGYTVAEFSPSRLEEMEICRDAGNTYHATGLLPSELAAQRDELLSALEYCAERLGVHMKHSDDLIAHMQAHKAITNAKGKTK